MMLIALGISVFILMICVLIVMSLLILDAYVYKKRKGPF